MSRLDLIKKLREYDPIDSKDREQTLRLIRFIEEYEDCFKRSLSVGHVTGSAWLVNGTGEKVLLTHHKKLGKWLQLGGHADGNSDVLAVALREAHEESGLVDIRPLSEDILDVDIHLIPKHDQEPAHYHYDVRFMFQTNSEDFIVGQESHKLAWVDIKRIQDLTTEESILRMARKWLQMKWKIKN